MIAVFLGAGFSRCCGVPLTGDLFREHPEVDAITRKKLVAEVTTRWDEWHSLTGGSAEEYLSYLQAEADFSLQRATWYIALAIALRVGKLEFVGMNIKITRHNLDRTTASTIHETFWDVVCGVDPEPSVVTTNYDILSERGLRHEPRPRANRPGFNYGNGPEYLRGGGYPSYAHIQRITISGKSRLSKLHGSISWSQNNGEIWKYHDCRPAIRGNPLIIAPVREKKVPTIMQSIWDQAEHDLKKAATWIIVGYSLPIYDYAVRDLLKKSSSASPNIHLLDPSDGIADTYHDLLPNCKITKHKGLPEGIESLRMALQ
ncbi:MAG: hypothetical protein ABL962_01450 [Fimbriimonadaceae bacterium]